MAARHVTIGPEFFAKSRNDYDNWRWALVREFFQNSIDCCSSKIQLDVQLVDNDTVITVTNDGVPMDEDILVHKLLSLGSSGKNFTGGTTGGFGKAKEILYFCHEWYDIRTADLKVAGSGASYDITSGHDYVDGTISRIMIKGDHVEDILTQARRFLDFAQVDCQWVINGERSSSCLRKGSPRRNLGFGTVYTNRTFNYVMVVRINGIPMFTYPTGLDRCVVVELHGNSNDVLTSNRDGLVHPFKGELSSFITELSVDKRSALRKSAVPRYVHYSGSKLVNSNRVDVADIVGSVGSVAGCSVKSESESESENVISGVDVDGNRVIHVAIEKVSTTNYWGGAPNVGCTAVADVRKTVTLGTDFVLKNDTDMMIPGHFDPGSGQFSAYSSRLVRIWGRLVLEMHRLFDHEASFSIGFVFDDGSISSTEAMYEQGEFGKVYYLNPAVVVEQNSSCSKSFKKRFKLTERDRIISIAAHEFVHGLGYGWHDERYANKLTDVVATVMKHRKRFNWCFA